MLKSTPRVAAAATAIAVAFSAPAFAQDSTNVIGSEGDWTAFSATSPKECWAVSAPKSTQNTDSSGNPREVARGDIRLYVAYRSGGSGEVSFSGGYPFAPDSAVDVNVGGQMFKLFTDGESAWTGSPSEDGKLVSALRAGSSVVITGRSARGTVTKDTFSLSGITAMTNQAQAACK
ncbi:invasion associated locus B family protein [Paracoccus laeviglucosivorans]|uniref:Invasion protein IalB, involved in pathogenesis n=1 Tax=Paracoccus laeviglucosivorans TaxID=1197861 RepID=A0A521DYK2_9RHOB|nr:invasion associated locus B family protein [Paracoccus laeviglucosivorans]SMO76151.1 hypothetical protein SAMN06265221_11059 [Paracoccus laeviglucosivorans]